MDNKVQVIVDHICSKLRKFSTRSNKIIEFFKSCHVEMMEFMENDSYIPINEINVLLLIILRTNE